MKILHHIFEENISYVSQQSDLTSNNEVDQQSDILQHMITTTIFFKLKATLVVCQLLNLHDLHS